MKIRDYLNKDNMAFFISPKGDVFSSDFSHIKMVTDNPKKFGITPDYVRKTYEKYNEKMGIEGRAREEILMKIINKGWIHIRKRPRYWSVNIDRISTKTKNLLKGWSKKLFESGEGRNKVIINSVSGNYHKETTIEDMSEKNSLEESVKTT